jgi:arsenate reductase-like glutaredoxin family protein
VKEIYVSKHKKLVHIDMAKDKPSTEKLAELMLGPTGNLRAPAIRVGDILLIGFDEESYKKVMRNS